MTDTQGLLHGMSGCQVRQEEAQFLASCRLHVLPRMNALNFSFQI